jgi:uncharacterized protein YjiS (DUF1127 family)
MMTRIFALLGLWRQRAKARATLAQLDRRALHDVGIDPGLAAWEAARPFWQPLVPLRETPQDSRRNTAAALFDIGLSAAAAQGSAANHDEPQELPNARPAA